jgi:hypothetical protein
MVRTKPNMEGYCGTISMTRYAKAKGVLENSLRIHIGRDSIIENIKCCICQDYSMLATLGDPFTHIANPQVLYLVIIFFCEFFASIHILDFLMN